MWSDEMCAQDTPGVVLHHHLEAIGLLCGLAGSKPVGSLLGLGLEFQALLTCFVLAQSDSSDRRDREGHARHAAIVGRSEEHTSELQSQMRISYAVFCLKKK